MSQSLGELVWALGFDNTGLKKGAQEAGVEFEHMGKTLKDAMANQRQLIKEITLDIKNLNEAAKSGTFNQKTGAMADLTAAKKVLADEQARLLDMQKRSIEGNAAEANSTGGVIKSLKDWAIGAATAGAAIKIFKSIAESTETSSHLFEQAVAGMTSGVSYFFKTIASGDWKGFGSGIKNAITGGVEYVTAMEHINNLKNEQKVKSAQIDVEIGKNWNDVNSSDVGKRVTALKNIVALTKDKLTQEADLANQVYDKHKAALAKENGLTEQEIEDVSSNWSKIAEEVEKGEKVIKDRAKVGTGVSLIWGGGAAYSKAEKSAAFKSLKELGEYNDGIDSEADRLAKIAVKYGKVGKERAVLSTERATGIEATAKIDLEGKRIKLRLAAAEKQIKTEADQKSKAQIDYDTELGRQRIDTQIKLDQDLLNTRKDGTEKSLAQAELDYQKTVLAISKQKDKLLKDLNVANGGIDEKTGKKTSSYVSALPEQDQKQITDQLTLAETIKENAIVKINDEAGIKLKKLWDDINSTRLTGLEKARDAINDKYDKMVVDAAGNSEALKAIESERAKANQELIAKFSLDDFQKSVDWVSIFGDLDKVSTSALNEFRSKVKTYLATIGDGIPKKDLKDVTEAFDKLNVAIADRTPIKELAAGYEDYKAACDKVSEAQQKLNDLTDSGKGSADDLKTATENLSKAQTDRAASLSKMSAAANAIGKEGQKLVRAAQDVTGMLANLGVDVSEGVSKTIDGFGQMFDGLASIDLTSPMSLITGSIKVITGLVNTVSSIFGGGSKELSQGVIDYYDDLMATMSDVIAKHKDLIAEFSGAEAVSEAEKTIELINKQIDATRALGLEFLASRAKHSHSYGYILRGDLAEYSKEFKAIGVDLSDSKGGVGQLFTMTPAQLKQIKEEIPEAWAKIDDQTRAYLQTIINSGDELDATTKALGEALTGLSFDSAKDSLKSLLLSADTTMADIADNFESYMRNAIVNALINGELAPLIKQWYVDFTKAMEDGVLSEQEKKDLNKSYESIGQTGLDRRNAAFEAAGITPDATKGGTDTAAGQIKAALTEDTGTQLMGLWRRGIDESITQTGILSMSNGYLYAIEINTRRTADNTEFLKTSGTTNGRDKG